VPRLLLADPERLVAETTFAFLVPEASFADLARDLGPDEVAAIGDVETVVWGLGLSEGASLPDVDDRGRPYALRIVRVLDTSVLQGHLLVDRRHAPSRFPSASGTRAALVRAPEGRAQEVAEVLMDALADHGAAIEPTGDRMARFLAVDHAFRAVFLATGGLGLVLGAFGVGIVLLRNAAERRKELAVLRALGLPRGLLVRALAAEHGALLAAGLLLGTSAAVVGAWPSLRGGAEVLVATALITTATLGTGLAATFAGALMALRSPPNQALRDL
jgi:hypothetical protein